MADLGSATTTTDAIVKRGLTSYTPSYVAPERLDLKYQHFEPHQGDVSSAGLSLINRKHPELFAAIENSFTAKAATTSNRLSMARLRGCLKLR